MIYTKLLNRHSLKYDLKSDFKKIIYPKSKKEFECEGCKEMVLIGDNYCKVVGKYFDRFYCDKLCLKCAGSDHK